MVTNKRFTVASLSGLLAGFVCFGLALSSPGPLAWPVAIQIILSRALIGFAIGISCYHIGHWSLHGMVIGVLFSLPLAFSSLMADKVATNAPIDKLQLFISTIVLGMIYGLLIELITTVFFKAKQA